MTPKEKILAEVVALDPEAVTEGLTVPQLTELRDGLKTPSPPPPPPPPPVSGTRVADGKSVSSLRGVLDEGTAVSAKDFIQGQKDLDELIKSGAVVE